MLEQVDIVVKPAEVSNVDVHEALVRKALHSGNKKLFLQLHKRSIDARKPHAVYRLRYWVTDNESELPKPEITTFQQVNQKPVIGIVGAGPAGLFAALRCLELGYKPIIFERGKMVRERRRDLAAITKEGTVNPESNYCFGEGGAGTYSDGKLYTRSKKKGDVQKMLQLLIQFGAAPDIAIDAHPHIGTNKLPQIIEGIRDFILEKGGEVRFNCKVTDIVISKNAVVAVQLNRQEELALSQLILATGHSARDIFDLLHSKKVLLEAKPFAIGVRAEHPQELINQAQYKASFGDENLPPASYSLVQQVDNKGVFSFCMCPGGIIAPCATNQEEVVTNGWSPSKRNNPFANSGIVVTVDEKDFSKHGFSGPMAGLHYQQMIEKQAWKLAGKTTQAPGQRMTDFCSLKTSQSLGKNSYLPGLQSVNLHDVLPAEIGLRLAKAFPLFGQKMKGYYTQEAILAGVESRTSSPVRIPRDKDTLQHPEVKGLYPCGEGAGFAGGIISAAIDGWNCATAACASN